MRLGRFPPCVIQGGLRKLKFSASGRGGVASVGRLTLDESWTRRGLYEDL